MISERVQRLREQNLETRPTLSAERAQLVTEFYSKQSETTSTPILRALLFQHLMQHKQICILPDELIVGEKGPAPKATPTWPELCCHSLQDLEVLNTRAKIPFSVDTEARSAYEEKIIPFWQGKSMRDLIFREMSEEWKNCYNAGIFTEFMEQRAPGHTVMDDKIYNRGFQDFKHDIEKRLRALDFLNDSHALAKKQQLMAMLICADALILFARRYSEAARELAAHEYDPQRKAELKEIANVCLHVPAHSPRTFWEALQYYWFVHLGVTTELNTWDSFSPGRLDQHLYPFYKNEIDKGTLTREKAEELLQCFWIKFNNQPAPPKVGITAAESSTYTDFAQISSGGCTADGADGVNEVSFLILDVVENMRLLQPSASIQVSNKTPDRFLKRAVQIIRTGFGQPSVFNSDLIIQQLVRQGKSITDARNGGSSGCVEIGAFGKENYNLTGYFNLAKVLEITLNNGNDPASGIQIGLKTGDAAQFHKFNDLFSAFQRQLYHFVDIKIRGNNIIERLYARFMPAPFMSLLIDDCIASGTDYHDGGARYNTSYIQGVGLGSVTDALTAIQYHVYDEKTVTMDSLLAALHDDFKNHTKLHKLLLHKTPKYGNDDDYADRIMMKVFEAYYNAVDNRPNTRGGHYHVNFLSTTAHVYFGSVTGALPDGRKSGLPLSEGISPVQGADHNGPTAVLKSAAKMDQICSGGTLLNQKFTPQLLKDEMGVEKFRQLIRTYFRLDGHHIQFNVVDRATLEEAKKHPEQHRNLIVRVAGYSDYFCDLPEALQDEIIARTEHQDM